LKYLTTEGMEFNNQMFKNSINLIPDPSERTSITFNANTLPLKYNIEYSIIAHSVTRYTICARVNESIKILITTGNKISFSNIPKGLIFCKTYKTV
jgi:hypothetical protein